MMVKHKRFTKAIALLFALMICFSASCVTAHATTYGGRDTNSVTVYTKSNWFRPGSESITLKQKKCQYNYRERSWGKWVTKKASVYPNYTITIRNDNTGKKTTKTWNSGSIKLSLARDAKYTITVSYDHNRTWLDSGCKLGNWVDSPSWWVNSSCKCTYW